MDWPISHSLIIAPWTPRCHPEPGKKTLLRGLPLDFHDLGGHVVSRCCLGLSKPQPPRAQSLGQAAAFVGPGSLTNEDQVEGRVSWGEAKLGRFLNEVTWNHSRYVVFSVVLRDCWAIFGSACTRLPAGSPRHASETSFLPTAKVPASSTNKTTWC